MGQNLFKIELLIYSVKFQQPKFGVTFDEIGKKKLYNTIVPHYVMSLWTIWPQICGHLTIMPKRI